GADRPRHRGPRAGGDRRLDPRRVDHGPTRWHGKRLASRRAGLREGGRARRFQLARPGSGCPVPLVAPLPLPLRNRLAELILEASEPGEARETVCALARIATDGTQAEAADADRLLALGWFETVPPAGVRLRGAYRAHGSALAARASRAAV